MSLVLHYKIDSNNRLINDDGTLVRTKIKWGDEYIYFVDGEHTSKEHYLETDVHEIRKNKVINMHRLSSPQRRRLTQEKKILEKKLARYKNIHLLNAIYLGMPVTEFTKLCQIHENETTAKERIAKLRLSDINELLENDC